MFHCLERNPSPEFTAQVDDLETRLESPTSYEVNKEVDRRSDVFFNWFYNECDHSVLRCRVVETCRRVEGQASTNINLEVTDRRSGKRRVVTLLDNNVMRVWLSGSAQREHIKLLARLTLLAEDDSHGNKRRPDYDVFRLSLNEERDQLPHAALAYAYLDRLYANLPEDQRRQAVGNGIGRMFADVGDTTCTTMFTQLARAQAGEPCGEYSPGVRAAVQRIHQHCHLEFVTQPGKPATATGREDTRPTSTGTLYWRVDDNQPPVVACSYRTDYLDGGEELVLQDFLRNSQLSSLAACRVERTPFSGAPMRPELDRLAVQWWLASLGEPVQPSSIAQRYTVEFLDSPENSIQVTYYSLDNGREVTSASTLTVESEVFQTWRLQADLMQGRSQSSNHGMGPIALSRAYLGCLSFANRHCNSELRAKIIGRLKALLSSHPNCDFEPSEHRYGQPIIIRTEKHYLLADELGCQHVGDVAGEVWDTARISLLSRLQHMPLRMAPHPTDSDSMSVDELTWHDLRLIANRFGATSFSRLDHLQDPVCRRNYAQTVANIFMDMAGRLERDKAEIPIALTSGDPREFIPIAQRTSGLTPGRAALRHLWNFMRIKRVQHTACGVELTLSLGQGYPDIPVQLPNCRAVNELLLRNKASIQNGDEFLDSDWVDKIQAADILANHGSATTSEELFAGLNIWERIGVEPVLKEVSRQEEYRHLRPLLSEGRLPWQGWLWLCIAMGLGGSVITLSTLTAANHDQMSDHAEKDNIAAILILTLCLLVVSLYLHVSALESGTYNRWQFKATLVRDWFLGNPEPLVLPNMTDDIASATAKANAIAPAAVVSAVDFTQMVHEQGEDEAHQGKGLEMKALTAVPPTPPTAV